MNILKALKSLTKFEICLWAVSVAVITVSFFLSKGGDVLSFIASLIGVTSLIFLARGFAFGQILMIIFSTVYGIISFRFSYYGEMLTYIGMTLPMAVVSLVSWIRHPYKKSAEVEVSRLNKKKIAFIVISSVAVTVAFYYILKAFNTANLLPSTVSVLTSYIAATLTAFRSPYFALGYACNDLVLIVLWVLAAIEDFSYLPMVMCFAVFFVNDMYGFICWKKMEKRQEICS
ncbi:MAG: nicotinamide mononucleotide transporter [Clostridia bacterium]|nr:nicotinamide mononucleotide transporter [Clostridia bacterium]